jgi:hypothetical protein
MESGLINPRTPMEYPLHAFLASYREFPYREIGTHAVVSHCSHETPIPELRCHLFSALSPGPHAFRVNREIVFWEFAISVAPVHRTFQILNSDTDAALSSMSPSPRRAIGYREIAISNAVIPLHGKTPNVEP